MVAQNPNWMGQPYPSASKSIFEPDLTAYTLTRWQKDELVRLETEWQAFRHRILEIGLSDELPTTIADLEELAMTICVSPKLVNEIEYRVDQWIARQMRRSQAERRIAMMVAAKMDQGTDHKRERDNDDQQRTADRKADKKRGFAEVPKNHDVLRLAKRINAEDRPGETQIAIALRFTDGNERYAETLLRQVRRFRHLLRKKSKRTGKLTA